MPADLPAKWLTVDPGEDTGWSLWEGAEPVKAGTDKLWLFIDMLDDGLTRDEGIFAGVELVVCEDWSLYSWKLNSMAWDMCRTARGIGAITLICRQTRTTFRLQAAKIKQRAVAGGAEVYFDRPLHQNRHQNDAKMHGVYYLQVELLGRPDDGRELTPEELDAIRPGEEHYG